MIGAPARRLTQVLSTALIVVGAVLVAYALAYYGYVLYQEHESGLAAPGVGLPEPVRIEEPPLLAAPMPSGRLPEWNAPPPQRIIIPTIDVDSRVVELGTTYDARGQLVWETADHAVGHHMGTANPGEQGNIVMSGHVSSPIRGEGNVFNRLWQLKIGEQVVLQTVDGSYTYRVVDRKVVEPTEVSVMDPTETQTLTLITCYPDLIYSHRLVVTAKPVNFTQW